MSASTFPFGSLDISRAYNPWNTPSRPSLLGCFLLPILNLEQNANGYPIASFRIQGKATRIDLQQFRCGFLRVFRQFALCMDQFFRH